MKKTIIPYFDEKGVKFENKFSNTSFMSFVPSGMERISYRKPKTNDRTKKGMVISMKKIKVAQIGTSKWSHGSGIWSTMVKHPEAFELVGFALPENEREKFPDSIKCFEGYREMTVEEILSDPEIEAVCVETEEIYLTKYASLVAKAGKHLHMEKPGGVCLRDFEELIGILKEKELVFSLGYMYRFNPKINEAIERVRRGEIGAVSCVEAQMSCRHGKELRDWLKAFPGGMMFFLGCHLIDLIYRIQGEPERIIPLNCSSGFDGVSGDDIGMTVFKYPNGVSFIKTASCESGGYERRRLLISGECGTFELRPLEGYAPGGEQYTTLYECFGKEWTVPEKETTSEPFGRYDGMMMNFAEMVQGKKNPYTYDYELELYKLVLRACGMEA